jgi:hypothetical protein
MKQKESLVTHQASWLGSVLHSGDPWSNCCKTTYPLWILLSAEHFFLFFSRPTVRRRVHWVEKEKFRRGPTKSVGLKKMSAARSVIWAHLRHWVFCLSPHSRRWLGWLWVLWRTLVSVLNWHKPAHVVIIPSPYRGSGCRRTRSTSAGSKTCSKIWRSVGALLWLLLVADEVEDPVLDLPLEPFSFLVISSRMWRIVLCWGSSKTKTT